MATEQDVMRLVAEVVDKSTGTLKKIQDAFKQIGDEGEKAHKKGSKAASEHHKHIKELHEKLEKTKEFVGEAMVPVMASLGIAAVGVGEAIGMVAEKIKGASEQYQILNDTVRRGHVSSQFVQGMGTAFQRLGMDASKANEFIGETGETLDKLRRGNAQEMQRLTSTFGNTLPFIARILQGAHSYEEASQRVMKALTNERIPIDQRRKLAEAFHIDPRIASKSAEEVGEALEKSMKEASKHALNQDLLKKLDDAYTELSITQDKFWNDLINRFGPAAVTGIEKVTHAIEMLDEAIKPVGDFLDKHFHPSLNNVFEPPTGGKMADPSSGRIQTGPAWEQLKRALGIGTNDPRMSLGANPNAFNNWTDAQKLAAGISPISFNEGGEGPIYRGVKQGVLDAFMQLMGERSIGRGGGGIQNASFTPSDGYGGGGGGRSGRLGGYGGGGSAGGGGDDYASPSPGARGSNGSIPSNAGAGTDEYLGAAKSGSEYLRKRRERFAKEMQDPNVRAKVKAMMQTEGTPLQSLEAALNRADYTGKSLSQTLSPSFYGPMRNRSHFASVVAAMRNGGGKKYDALIAKALGGSNTTLGYTDQGMPTDPNGSRRNPLTARDHISVRDGTGLNEFTDWEGGPGGRRGARAFREMIEKGVREAEDHPHGYAANLRDHIRNKSLLKAGRRSGLMGGEGGELGHAKVTVDFNNMPKGTRTSASASGLFKTVKLNRGRAMPMADQEA